MGTSYFTKETEELFLRALCWAAFNTTITYVKENKLLQSYTIVLVNLPNQPNLNWEN